MHVVDMYIAFVLTYKEMYSCMSLICIYMFHLYQHRNVLMHVVDMYIAFVST